MLKEGDKAPAFKLVDEEGKNVSLADFKGKPVVIFFYPKALTTGCTQEACDFRDSISREAFTIAHDISSYSLAALAKAARPMMRGHDSAVLTLSYLGAMKN